MKLPDDEAEVIAMTYPSLEYDREAEEVTGPLEKRPVGWMDRVQCFVGGVQVDPETVRAVTKASQSAPPATPVQST